MPPDRSEVPEAAAGLAPIFLRDGQPVDEAAFVARAIDPAASVAIDACAGSGKTTLLVRRIVRCLLDGAPPDSILAITFTRAAAQEMQVRVRAMLRRLAFEDDAVALGILRDDLHLGERALAMLADARALYERTLTDRRGLDVTTFHRWFWQLARRGSRIGASEPVTELAEREVELLDSAWLGWLDQRREPGREPLATAFDRTVRELGASVTEGLMRSFVAQRTEWVASLSLSEPGSVDGPGETADFGDEAVALGRALASHRAQFGRWAAAVRTEVPACADWSDERLEADAVPALAQLAGIGAPLRRFADLLARAGKTGQGIGRELEAALGVLGPPDAAVTIDWSEWWSLLVKATTTGKPPVARKIRWQQADFAAVVDRAGGAERVRDEWEALSRRIVVMAGLCADRLESLPMNRDLLLCSVSLACAYQALKRRRGVLDFVDLEAIAARLLRDEGLFAYLQMRLDRRYRHLLFDEFQDTSSLQWTVIGQWLMAYAGAGAGSRPSVFVVGDPKQSIYRFRRAESRVFAAACALLQEAFDAMVLTTATTRRNAAEIMSALNESLSPLMPNFRPQATLAPPGPSLVWRLPVPATDVLASGVLPPQAAAVGLSDAGTADDGTADDDPATDWLTRLRGDDESHFRTEGLAIGIAIREAMAWFEGAGRPVAFGDVIVLARGRTGFAEYERALRSLDIPVVSDRKGGLLDSLEARDLIALLRLARDPDDDLSLAQVLRSPLIGLSADHIGQLAGRCLPSAGPVAGGARRESLWRCLVRQSVAGAAPGSAGAGLDLPGAHRRLADWTVRARRLPIHDFLDSVIAEVDAEAAYARCVDPAQREVVVGNLQAMVGLALDHDGGRYPGISRFLHQVGALGRLDDKDAPDEGRPVEHDAVRLMTVHGAKGLEADLVVIADARASKRGNGARFAIDWPPDAPAPRETWFRLESRRSSYLSRRLDEREAELAAIEDWNLLYVAATRARRGLIVSVAPRQNAGSADSWYDRLHAVPVHVTTAGADAAADAAASSSPPPPADRPETVRAIRLPDLGIGARGAAPGPADGPAGAAGAAGAAGSAGAATLALQAGTALHRALELMSAGLGDARVAAVVGLSGIDAALADRAVALARGVRALPELALAFEPASGRDEFELFDGAGSLLRIDRLARVGDALWIIDYKWSVTAGLRAAYLLQLQGYRDAVEGLPELPGWAGGPGRAVRVRTVLVDATAGRVEFDPH